MIVRFAHCHSVKYTHDEEAAIAALLPLREFAGVDATEMQQWFAAERDYAWSKDYWHVPGTDWFLDRMQQLYGREPEAVIVSLWKLPEFASHLIREHGFSCLICRSRSTLEKRGYLRWDHPMERAVCGRQSVDAPTLMCFNCAIDIPLSFSPHVSEKTRLKAVEHLLSRVVLQQGPNVRGDHVG